MKRSQRPCTLTSLALAAALWCGCGAPATPGIAPQQMADALHAVMESDRTVYPRQVVNRLQNEEGVIKASEHWKDDKALPLPAQMFRMGAEMVAAKDAGFVVSSSSQPTAPSASSRNNERANVK